MGINLTIVPSHSLYQCGRFLPQKVSKLCSNIREYYILIHKYFKKDTCSTVSFKSLSVIISDCIFFGCIFPRKNLLIFREYGITLGGP